jgi:hypothetical protein
MKSGSFEEAFVFALAAATPPLRGPRTFAARFSSARPARLPRLRPGIGGTFSREHERPRAASLAGRNGGHRAARRDRSILGQRRSTVPNTGILVVMLDEKPVVALAPGPIVLHPHQHPAAAQALSLERELQIAAGQPLLRRLVAFGFSIAAVPELNGTAAVFALRNCALEVAVVERMILDFHHQTLVVGIE